MIEPHRILIVEDEEVIRETVATIFMEEGYDVRTAENGQEALRVVQEWLPTVIVLDLMMPVMDGWTFREMQRGLAGPVASVPVILLSGARNMRSSAELLGAADALAKPFDLEDLLATVERVVAVT